MALSINTNLAALQSQNSLNDVTQALQKNQHRLATGLRINSAADDAAGLAISDRMTAQIRGLNQAVRNANDGISMLQTAEGALQETTNMLNRMRELAVQAKNGTLSNSDRTGINQEFQELVDEIDRVAQSTTFNGKSLLNGFGKAKFQVWADVGSQNVIEVDMSDSMRAKDIGKRYTGTVGLTNGTGVTLTNSEVKVNGETLALGDLDTSATMGQVKTSAWGIAQAINNNNNLNIDAEAQTVNATAASSTINGGSAGSYSMQINGVQVFTASATTINASQIVNAVNAKSGTLGITASTTSGGGVKLSNDSGGNIKVAETGALGAGFFTTGGTTVMRGQVELSSKTAITFSDEAANTEFTNVTSNGQVMFNTLSDGLNTSDVTTVDNAKSAIQKIDAALNDVDTFRGTLGAAQNRLESTISNVENVAQNMTDARSRIMDADIAKESASMARNNIRQQAAAAVLAQANQQPQLALQLLGT